MTKNNDILNELIGSSYSDISLNENSRVINIALNDLYNREDNRPIDINAVKKIAASIATDGLGQPILVRKVEGIDGYEIIAGQHRLEAYKLLNKQDDTGSWSKIPAFVKNLDDVSAKRLMLATNVTNNEVSKEQRQEYLVELVNSIKADRKENPTKYEGKTSKIVADFISASTGEDISQASVERAIKNKKDKNETEGDICSFIENSQNISPDWKNYCQQKPDMNVVNSISSLDFVNQERFYETLDNVYGEFNNAQIKEGLTCLNGKKQNTVNKYMKSLYSFFDYLEIAKKLGNDVQEDLIAVQNLLTLKSLEMNEEL